MKKSLLKLKNLRSKIEQLPLQNKEQQQSILDELDDFSENLWAFKLEHELLVSEHGDCQNKTLLWINAVSSFIEQMPFGGILINKESKIKQFNHNFAELVGEVEILKRPFYDLIDPNHKSIYINQFGRFLKTGKFSQIDLLLCSGRWVRMHLVPAYLQEVFDNDQYYVVFNDITELKSQSVEIKELDARLDFIQQNISYGILEIDTEGKVIGFNEYALCFFGEDITGRFLWDYFSDFDVIEVRNRIAALNDELPVSRLWQGLVEVDERKSEINLLFYRRRLKGESDYIVLFSDLTKTSGQQIEHLQQQKLESIGRLAGGVAHDLNNMLTPILGYADALLNNPEISPQIEQGLQVILGAADRSREMIQTLLSFTRKKEPVIKTEDLNSLIEGFIPFLQRTLREDIKIEFVPAKKPLFIKVDKSQIEQAIMNLCVNSQDAMLQGGTLEIELSAIEITNGYLPKHGDLKPGKYARIDVSDSGCGMSEDIKTKVFEPFYTTKPIGMGTGLGLSTVLDIVTRHGGTVEIKSEENMGTRFRLTFALEQQNGQLVKVDTHQKLSSDPSEYDKLIVLVEDDELVRSVTTNMLLSRGYKVLAFESGKQALATFQTKNDEIGLLISDVIMPDMNGRALYDNICTNYGMIPTIFISGYTDSVLDSIKADQKQVWFVSKPFTLKELITVVEQATGN